VELPSWERVASGGSPTPVSKTNIVPGVIFFSDQITGHMVEQFEGAVGVVLLQGPDFGNGYNAEWASVVADAMKDAHNTTIGGAWPEGAKDKVTSGRRVALRVWAYGFLNSPRPRTKAPTMRVELPSWEAWPLVTVPPL
jgi:hypothetical protein